MRWNSCVIFIIAVTFCVKFGKSATKILKMICWAFADSSFGLDKGFRMTYMFQGQSSVSSKG